MTGRKPFLLGLTGSIGMGKSTTADLFREAGVPVWDADAAVHRLYARGGAAVAPLAALVPEALEGGGISRQMLARRMAMEPGLLDRIEVIVHPLVAAERRRFLAEQEAEIVVLDVPLLFETGSQSACDAVAVVTAPEDVQRDRVLARPGMTPRLLEDLLARQVSDAEKRARADFVIDTSQGLEAARTRVHDILEKIRHRSDA